MARYVPPCDYVGPSEEWADEYDAQTELSVAPAAQAKAGVEVVSGRAPQAAGVVAAGGYSAEELAALADEDDWDEAPTIPPAQTAQPYGSGSKPAGSGYNQPAHGGYGTAPPPYGGAAAPAAGEVLCATCGEPCLQRTSNTPKNPGRQFYKCANQACNFFKWADELDVGGGGGAGAGGYISPAAKRRVTEYGGQQGGSQGGYQAGYGYGYGGSGAPPPVPGTNTFQAAADGGALKDKSNDVCFKCNQPGHWSSNCPTAGAGGGDAGGGAAKTGTCFKCGQPGHWASQCPNPGGANAGGGGGYGGGSSWGGPQGGAGGSAYGGGGGGAKTGTCFKCGETGHWSRDCPSQAGGAGGGGYGGSGGGYGGSGGGAGAGGGKSGSCFKCGEAGHWSSNCPNQGGGGRGGGAYGGSGGGKRKYEGGGGGYGGGSSYGGYGKGSARGDAGACFKCGGDHYSNACPNK